MKDIRQQTRLWSCRGLSLYGKITIIKSLPKMLYVFSILPTSGDFIKQLNAIIYNFLWKGPDKIARQAAINDLEFGGLNVIDIEILIKASRLAWIGKLFSNGSLPWKAYVNHLLKDFGGEFLFSCNYDVEECKIYRNFIMSFFSGGQILENLFQQSLLCRSKYKSGTIKILR